MNEYRSYSVLFQGVIKSPLKKCLRELRELRKRVLRIEKEMFPKTGKGGKDG